MLTKEHRRLIAKYMPYFKGAAEKYNIPLAYLLATAFAESKFDHKAVSGKFAQGLMQVMPNNLRKYGISDDDFTDPKKNIYAGALHISLNIKDLKRDYNADPTTAEGRRNLSWAYNAGASTFKKGKLWRETKKYLKRLAAVYPEVEQIARNAGATSKAQPIQDKLYGLSQNDSIKKEDFEKAIATGKYTPTKKKVKSSVSDVEYIISGGKVIGLEVKSKNTSEPTVWYYDVGAQKVSYTGTSEFLKNNPNLKIERAHAGQIEDNPPSPLAPYPPKEPHGDTLSRWTSIYDELAQTPNYNGGVIGVKSIAAELIIKRAGFFDERAYTEEFWTERGLKDEYWMLYPQILRNYENLTKTQQPTRPEYARFLSELHTKTLSNIDLSTFQLEPKDIMRGLIQYAKESRNPAYLSEEVLSNPILADERVIMQPQIEDGRQAILKETGGIEHITAQLVNRIGKGYDDQLIDDMNKIVATPLITPQKKREFLADAIIKAIQESPSVDHIKLLAGQDFWKKAGLSDLYEINKTAIDDAVTRAQIEHVKMAEQQLYAKNLQEAYEAIAKKDSEAFARLRPLLKEEDVQDIGDRLLYTFTNGDVSLLQNPETFKEALSILMPFELSSKFIKDMFNITDLNDIGNVDKSSMLFGLIPEKYRGLFVPKGKRDLFELNLDIMDSVPSEQRKVVLERYNDFTEEHKRMISDGVFVNGSRYENTFVSGVKDFFGKIAGVIDRFDESTQKEIEDVNSPFNAPLRDVWNEVLAVSLELGQPESEAIRRANDTLSRRFGIFYNDKRYDRGILNILDEPSIIPIEYATNSGIEAIEAKVTDLIGKHEFKGDIDKTKVVWLYINGQPTNNFMVQYELDEHIIGDEPNFFFTEDGSIVFSIEANPDDNEAFAIEAVKDAFGNPGTVQNEVGNPSTTPNTLVNAPGNPSTTK